MKVYTYTPLDKSAAILGKQAGEESGLALGRRIGLQFPSLDNPKAIYGLLEPKPDSWVRNPHFPDTWGKLVHDFRVMSYTYYGTLLLELNVDPPRDRAFVAERGHLEGFLYRDKQGIPQKFLHERPAEAENAIMQSLVPLNEYVSTQQAYSLPEVVLLNPFPAERITVSSQQPFIEEKLAEKGDPERDIFLHILTHPLLQQELSAWRMQYEGQHGPLEISGGRKERL
ncbi:MAG TPA: hypothetical protein VLF93_04580 [Candidatus Saccharimonadales bacterium]|nr:hypothetical protein [Candidatus Saccharimonadales bacterium]